MKIDLIKASAKSAFKSYKKYMGSPPQNIFSVAADTPNTHELALYDETVDIKANPKTKADLVTIFMSTPDALRGYELGDHYRKQGKVVVFGGLHPTFMPGEALQHGDAVIIGEAEGVWEQLLNDVLTGSLQPKYERQTPFDLSMSKPFPTKYISKHKYNDSWTVMVSRGCRFACSFCLVTPFFKPKMRYRPVGQVVDEVKNCGAKWIELHSDNLTADRDYALELFKALKPLKVNWVGETTINIAKDDELLHWAAESGLRYLLVGLETPSKSALKQSGKAFVKTEEVKDHIKKLHEYDITVDSAMLFGFDEHDENIFEESFEFCKEIDLDVGHSVIMIPFPGSQLYNQLDAEGRILTKDWSRYSGEYAVFQPKNMTLETLEKGAQWFYDKISNRNTRLTKRYMKLWWT
jgi:radical SAM superfamily enzyme YgiQ (UPF0313 family)